MRWLLTILVLAGASFAQVLGGGDYTIRQGVISPGGGTSAGEAYSVTGTVGQPVAGTRSDTLQKELTELRAIVCEVKPEAGVCRRK